MDGLVRRHMGELRQPLITLFIVGKDKTMVEDGNDAVATDAPPSQYIAWQLTRQAGDGSVESLASTLVDSQVDLNPHQVDAALFACRNPLSRGVILTDEVGLGKTIEAGLVISQRWTKTTNRWMKPPRNSPKTRTIGRSTQPAPARKSAQLTEGHN